MWRNRTTAFLCSKLLKPYFFTPATITVTTTTTTMTDVKNSVEPQQNSIKSPHKSVEESDVGIICYISQLPGFRGILKQRYSDFIVNEVDMDGNVVHLTSLDAPPELVEKKEEKVKVDEQSDKSYTSEIEAFRLMVGDSDADRLKEFIEKINSGVGDDVPTLVLSPSSDKAHRTGVHNFFKEKLKFLVTDTIDGLQDSSKCIRVRPNSGGNSNRGRQSRKRKDRNDKPFDKRGSQDWPENLGKFLRFHLYKENKDTQEALRLIGKMLGVQPRSFGFSGTKDKRSVSTQRVTMFKQRASRLASLNQRLIGIKVGDFCHVEEGLQLGQLLGNRFTITLRGVVADSEDTIKASADALGKHGFINYFGLQRFGSGSVPTHLIGAALLRGEWKAAVDMILDPREGERDDIRKIREDYKESNDIERTLRRLPHNMVAERAVLQCLKKFPGNYVQALKAIPRTLRMMYVHSYQSYLWNHAASIRVQKYGADRVVVGDLVYSKEDCNKEVITTHLECDNDISDEPDNDSNLEELPDVDIPDEKNLTVKAVDEEDLVNQKYTFDDVVLPLPGSRAVYPANDVADVYHDLARKYHRRGRLRDNGLQLVMRLLLYRAARMLQQLDVLPHYIGSLLQVLDVETDNISLTESIHNVKEFSITSMSGAYRRVFQKPVDYEWELLKYVDASTPLADTDLDILAMSKSANNTQKEDKSNGNKVNPFNSMTVPDKCGHAIQGDNTAEDATISSNSKVAQIALKLSFTLPASCYATMAIRELLKTSTSVAFHKTLNDQK